MTGKWQLFNEIPKLSLKNNQTWKRYLSFPNLNWLELILHSLDLPDLNTGMGVRPAGHMWAANVF